MSGRLLWVTDEVPDPTYGGGSIRQYELLKRLAKVTKVDLLLVGVLRDMELRQSLNSVTELAVTTGSSLPAPIRRLRDLSDVALFRRPMELSWSRSARELLRRHLGDTSEYSLVQVEHQWFAPLLPPRRSNQWAITLHNLLSVRAAHAAQLAQKRRVRWLLSKDGGNARRFENWIATSYDTTIVVSDADAALLNRTVVIPNGVDLQRFESGPLPTSPTLLFCASFNYEPNVDAALWLCEHILPRVRARLPAATVTLVGRKPDQRVRALDRISGVETHFDVPSVIPFLTAARVVVVPIRIGSGTRIKALEAMAAGRPIAGTPVGLEGLGLEHGVSAEISVDADGLAAGITRLLRDEAYAVSLALAGRRIVSTHYSWDRIASAYIDRVLAPSV